MIARMLSVDVIQEATSASECLMRVLLSQRFKLHSFLLFFSDIPEDYPPSQLTVPKKMTIVPTSSGSHFAASSELFPSDFLNPDVG